MRIRIIFKLRNKGATLPFQHQHLLFNLIDMMMSNKSFNFKEKNLYNFSGLKGQTKVSRTGLSYLSSRVTLVMSSYSQDFIDIFLDELFKHNLIELGEVILTPELVERESEFEFESSTKYLCLSPLVPSSNMTTVTADDMLHPETLSDMLYDSTMYRMEKSGIYTPSEIEEFYQFQLIPDKTYLQKINVVDKKAGRAYYLNEDSENPQEIIGYTFPFKLLAHPKVQHFIFNCGFGEFTSLGYGMLDKTSSSSQNSIQSYRAELGQKETNQNNTKNNFIHGK